MWRQVFSKARLARPALSAASFARPVAAAVGGLAVAAPAAAWWQQGQAQAVSCQEGRGPVQCAWGGGGKLQGKVAIVTGGSSGIGKAVAEGLAKEGAKVVMVSRSLPKLEAAAKGVPGAICKAADVTDRKAIHALVNEVVSTHQKVDIIVNCAGVMYFTLMKNAHYDEWDQTIDINCKGTVNACGAVFPHMLKAKTGHIVNISSDAARTVFPALTVYNAAKSFVQVFSKGLRAECVGTGLRVTDIQPGDTATNLIMTNSDKEAAEKMGVAIGKVVGAGGDRTAVLDPEDIASAVVYAVTAPAHVGVHEVLIEPRDQMFGDPTAMGA